MNVHEALSFEEADLIAGYIYSTLSIHPTGFSWPSHHLGTFQLNV